MKARTSLTLVVILLVLAISVFVGLVLPNLNRPYFKKSQTPASFIQISYDFLSSRPFDGGKMWICTGSGGTNWESFVYDLEQRRILGQVNNGWPVMLFGDEPQVLCSQPASDPTWKKSFSKVIADISGGRIKFRSFEGLTYWLLDLQTDTAKRLGDIPGSPNQSFFPSPDFHYCYTARHGSSCMDYYLLDLRKGTIKQLDLPPTGMPPAAFGWWDNERILCQDTNSDFYLYHVRNKVLLPLIASAKIAAFLKENGIAEGATRTHAFTIWNGRENDFYLTDTHQKWLAEESFLIKLERPDGRMNLLSARFKFEWSDHLDASGRQYLYSGRKAGERSDGVFLRNLDSGITRVLVAPENNKYFSIPRFYRDSVIYFRSNAVWRISLDGSNTVKLL